MVVRAVYNNDEMTILSDSDYSINNGSNLKLGQTSVTIKYLDKTADVSITVNKSNGSNENQNDDKIKNSKFDNAKCVIKSISSVTDKETGKDYAIINTEITGIEKALNNDSYGYSYYLSPNGKLEDIEDWIKISIYQSPKDKLVFTIDSRDITNIDDLYSATNMYIYIRETVAKGGNQSIVASKAMKFEGGSALVEDNSELNVDEKNDMLSLSTDSNNGSNDSGDVSLVTTTQGQTSSTASPIKLPNTGNGFLIFGIVAIVVFGIVLFIRYEYLNRMMKQ